jgi:Tol biopolymer transport system component
MKQTFRIAVMVALASGLLLSRGLLAQGSRTAQVQFKAAQHKEEVEGDLKAAIEQYAKLAQSRDRAIAAKALVRMADCYQKLGDAQSRTIYERVVREFADQKEAAAEARARLRALGLAFSSTLASGPVVRRVWAPDFDLLAAPSPDGQHLTYVDWTTGDLAVREMTSGKSRHLTNKGSWFVSGELALFSTVSPNARQVAYNWFGGSDPKAWLGPGSDPKAWLWSLRLIDLDGGDPRILYSNSDLEYLQPTAWSSDGTHILLLLSDRDGTFRIALASVPSGSVRVLKSLDWRQPNHMTFSPDGRYIVYDFPPEEDSPSRDVFLLATDGSREIVLAKHPASDVALGWVPNSKSVLFVSDRTGTMDAWIVQVDDGKPGGEPELVKRDIGRIEPLGFTSKGAFYYGLPTGMEDVFIAPFDPATGQLSAPPARATQRSVGSNRGPVWSPDGRLFAFMSGVRRTLSGSTPEFASFVIRSIDSGEERELVPKVTRLYQLPRWSPDGRSLIANGYDRKRREGIYVIDVLTGDATLVVDGQMYNPGWLPDGKTIFYRSNQRAIIARNLQDGQERELYRGRVQSLTVSPDGQYLAFRSFESKTAYVRVVATTGGEARAIAEWPGDSNPTIAWESDSRHVFAATPGAFWRIPVEGGTAQQFKTDITGVREMAFSPDGKRVAFTAGESKTEVWVMENFLPTLSTSR